MLRTRNTHTERDTHIGKESHTLREDKNTLRDTHSEKTQRDTGTESETHTGRTDTHLETCTYRRRYTSTHTERGRDIHIEREVHTKKHTKRET